MALSYFTLYSLFHQQIIVGTGYKTRSCDPAIGVCMVCEKAPPLPSDRLLRALRSFWEGGVGGGAAADEHVPSK